MRNADVADLKGDIEVEMVQQRYKEDAMYRVQTALICGIFSPYFLVTNIINLLKKK
jgi:hypothetical protein